MKKKIAYVLSRFPTVSETFILYEIVELIKLGLDIQIFPLIEQNEPVMHSEVKAIMPRVHYSRLFSFNTIKDHFFWFRKKPITYIQTMLSAILMNIRSFKFLSRAIAVLLLSPQFARKMEELKVDHIHAHAATHPTLMAYIVSRLTGIPYSFTAHSSDIYFNQTMLSEKIHRANFVVTISRYNVDFLKRFSGSSADNIHIVHCGINPSQFSVSQTKNAEQPIKLLCVGRLEEIKGHQYLIEALSIFKKDVSDFICYLVGDGKLQTEIQQRVDQLDLTENIKLLGFQTHERVSELLDRSDILVLPSLSEGIPVAVMEAMASGLPVIATNVTGVPELVEDGVTGLLVPSKNSSALSKAILKLVRSPDLRNRMGTAGRRKVLEEFNMNTAILDLYHLFVNS